MLVSYEGDTMIANNPIKTRNTIFVLAFHLALAYKIDKCGDNKEGSRLLWALYNDQVSLARADTNMKHSAHAIAKTLMDLPVSEIHNTLIRPTIEIGKESS